MVQFSEVVKCYSFPGYNVRKWGEVEKSGEKWWIMVGKYLCLFLRRSVHTVIMTFFTGEYECKLDAKGRLTLPAKVKGNLPEDTGTELMIGKSFDRCLFLYTMVEYKKIIARIAGLSEFDKESRVLKRTFLTGCQSVEPDANGRFLIPKSFMGYAGLDRQAVLVGMGNHLEIWNPESFRDSLITDPEEFSALAKEKLDGES